MDSEPAFSVGDIVAYRADASRRGSVIALLAAVRGQHRYRVFHSSGDIREYLEDQIEPLALPEELFSESGVSPAEFVARLSALRLNRPQMDSIYAL